MPVNQYQYAEQTQIVGPVSMVNDPQSVNPQAIATSGAIAVPPGANNVKLTAAAAATGVTMPQGSFDGQLLWITINTAAANTVTFAAKASSYVAGGAATSLAGLATHLFRWDATDALWYQVGPLTN